MTRKICIALCAAGLFAASHAMALDFRHYSNSRFGTAADVPAHFIADPPPTNNDGRHFVGSDGGSITVYGSLDFTGSGIEGYRAFLEESLESEGWQLTYKTGGSNWFVLSGVRNDEIIYHRTEQPKGCNGDLMHQIEFRYPKQNAAEWKPIVERGASSLDGPCE